MKPHRRMEPIGRVCMICGWGQGPRRGGVMGAAPILRALGYEWRTYREGDPPRPPEDVEYTGLGFAHLRCIDRARARLKPIARCWVCGANRAQVYGEMCAACLSRLPQETQRSSSEATDQMKKEGS